MSRRLVLAMALAAVVATAVPAPVGARQVDRITGQLVLASQTSWVRPDGELVLRVRPVTTADPGDVELGVTVHGRVITRSQFARTLNGGLLGRVVRAIRPAALVDLLPVTEALAVTIRLRPDELRITTPGVYPVAVVLREEDGGRLLDRLVTHLVLVPPDVAGPQLGVAWVVRFHAPPAVQPGGSRKLAGGARLTQLAQTLAAYRDLPLTVAPTPETIEAMAAGTPAERAAVRSLADALRGRQLLARPYVAVDVARMVASGLDAHVGEQLEHGSDALARLLGTEPDGSVWVADNSLDNDAVAELRGRQIDRFVVPEDTLVPVELPVTLAQPFTLESGPGRRQEAALADGGLASHFRNGGDQALAAHHLLADLAVLWGDAPARARAVAAVTPRSWQPTRAFLDTVLSGLAGSPLVEPLTLSTLFEKTDRATTGRGRPLVRRLARQPAVTLGVRPSLLRSARDRLQSIGSVLPPGSPTYQRLHRQLLVTEADGLRPAERTAYLEGLDRAIERQLSALEVARSRTVTITAREAEIPLAILNRSSETLTVRVRIESDKLEFPGGTGGRAEKTVRLLPRNTTVSFPVRARTSGAFPLRVALFSPEGGLLLADTRWTVRSTAFSGLGLVLSLGAGAFLLAWWARHAVRGRRAKRLVPA